MAPDWLTISNYNFNNPQSVQRTGGYVPVQPPQTYVEEPTSYSTGNNIFMGLSPMVANAKQNEDGSYDIPQYVDSGYGRRGISHKTFIS